MTLLQWSMARDAVDQLGTFPDPARSDVREWIAQSAGPIGDLVIACVASGHGLDAFPVGLICGVVFAQVQGLQPDLAAAAVRLERFTGDRRIRPEEGRRWAETAAWVARNKDDAERARPLLERADGLLQELHVVAYAGLSEVLPSGFEARLSAFGTALSTFLGARSEDSLRRVESCASSVLGHDRGHWSTARNERVQMALRLARWLTDPIEHPLGTDLFQLFDFYLEVPGSDTFVAVDMKNWARSTDRLKKEALQEEAAGKYDRLRALLPDRRVKAVYVNLYGAHKFLVNKNVNFISLYVQTRRNGVDDWMVNENLVNVLLGP